MTEGAVKETGSDTEPLNTEFNHQVRHTKLENGIDILTQNVDPNNDQIVFTLSVRAGAMDDPEGKSGLAHFFEHLLVKGGAQKQFQMRQGQLNASTNGEEIKIFGSIQNTQENIEFLSEYLRSAVLDPLDENDFHRERNRVLNEMGMMRDKAGHVHDEMMATLFDNKGVIYETLGVREEVEAVTIEELESFRSKYFTGSNMHFCVSGNVDHQDIHSLFSNAFSLIPVGEEKKGASAVSMQPKDVRKAQEGVNQLYMMLCFPIQMKDFKSDQINDLAAGYISSLIKDYFTDGMGLSYVTNALYYMTHETNGVFCIDGNFLPEQADKILPALKHVLSQPLDAELLESVIKNKVRGWENCLAVPALMPIEYMTNIFVRYGEALNLNASVDVVKSITVDEVVDRIYKILSQEPALTAYGDHSKLHSREEFAAAIKGALPPRPGG